jgi:hypothetical protein
MSKLEIDRIASKTMISPKTNHSPSPNHINHHSLDN